MPNNLTCVTDSSLTGNSNIPKLFFCSGNNCFGSQALGTDDKVPPSPAPCVVIGWPKVPAQKRPTKVEP